MIEVLGVLAAFATMSILRARNTQFYVAITVAAMIIGLTSGGPPAMVFEVLLKTLTEASTWTLCIAVALISVLGYALKETGLMVRFIEGLSTVLPGSVLLATIPALFGFLSMPGGALMSAPFIEPEADRLGLRPEHKTYFNVWFRHLLYWTNPITPSTIMAVTLSGFPVNTWLRVQSPLFFVMVAIGLIVGRRFIAVKKGGGGREALDLDAMKGVVPILLSVGLTLYGLPVWISLCVGIVATYLLGRVRPRDASRMAVGGFSVEIVLSAASMLYLRDMILASGSVTGLFDAVIGSGIPVLAVAMMISMMIGAVSGSPSMGVGIGFPILLPLFGAPNIHYTSIVFLGITCTYIASPLHLCTVLTNSYFKSDMNKVIRYLAPSSAALYVVGLAYHLLLNGM
jgi:integral membrane protein (TIGR00529 family)